MYRPDGQNNPLAPASAPAPTAAVPAAQPHTALPQQAQPPAAMPQAPQQHPAAPVVPEPTQMVDVRQAAPAATVEQIEAACPNAPADFVLSMIKQHATISAAQKAFIEYLTTVAQPAAQPVAQVPVAPTPAPQYVPQTPSQAPAAQAPIAHTMPGNSPITPEPSQSVPTTVPGGERDQYRSLVETEMDLCIRKGMSARDARNRAYDNVERKYPGLREKAYAIGAIPTVAAVPAQ